MKRVSCRPGRPALLTAAVAGAALVSAALAQPGGKDDKSPGGSGPSSESFVFQVCNNTPDFESIFVATVQIAGEKQFRASGWTQIAKGQCIEGPVRRPRVWIHARAGDTTWTKGIGTIVPICVNLSSQFDYAWDGRSRQCQPSEQFVDFVMQEIPPNQNLRKLELL